MAKEFKYEEEKVITLPLFKQQDDVPMFVRIMAPCYVGKEIKGSGEAMEPADLFRVCNLETGEEGEIIANAVLKSSLEEHFPDASYVGLDFKIVRSKVEGKRYKAYKIVQIKVK
jgi:hypothetical protein